MTALFSKIVVVAVEVVCSVLAVTGVLLLAFGFALVAAAIWIQERMED